jgi:hypothetical protein
MNYTTAVFLINDSVRAVLAVYEPNVGEKTMFKTMDRTIKPDDLVVVPTETRHGMTVVKVVEVDVDVDFDCATPVKWVLMKIDRSDSDRIEGMEAEAIAAIKSAEMTKKRADLRAAMMADSAVLRSLPITALAAPAAPNDPGISAITPAQIPGA